MSSNIFMKLQYLEFPDCSKEALIYIVKVLSESKLGGVPGLGASNEKLARDVAQDFIINVSSRKGHHSRKLSALHELQLLEMISSCLQEAPEYSCFAVFSSIFGGHVQPAKTSLMTKLVSMAISISCSAVLGCVALWMQEHGSQSQPVCDLAEKLVSDYCLLYPNINPAFRRLPQISSLFTCNLVTALTTIYPYTDSSKSPPLGLLESIVDWISDDPCLCSDSVRLVRIRSNYTCPISGLMRWCILGPLVTSTLETSAKSSADGASKQSSLTRLEPDAYADLMVLFSRLHLSVLLSLQAYKSMELKEHLFSYPDFYIVSKTLASHYKSGKCSESVLQLMNVLVDRLAQTVQVALTSGSLPEKFDVCQVCDGLPPNRLLQMVVTLRHGKSLEAMDLS